MWDLAREAKAQGLIFWAAHYCFFLGTYSFLYQLRTRRWSTTKGELIEAGIGKFGSENRNSEQKFTANALYQYTVSNVSYQGSRISPWIIVASQNARVVLKKQMSHIEKLPNGKVKVFYNPKKPNKSFLIVAGKFGLFITFLIIIIPIGSYYFKYHLK